MIQGLRDYREVRMIIWPSLFKALTGKSTTAVVRSIRLQRGRQLLLRTQLNVSEVAYEVGFRDPNYFSKCFQDEFGESPSSVRS